MGVRMTPKVDLEEGPIAAADIEHQAVSRHRKDLGHLLEIND
jgi:hypothetical protein